MSLIIDLIILGIIILCVFFGYKKGLTKCVIKILSFVIALAIAFVLFKPVSNLVINNTTLDDNIKNSIVSIVEEDVSENGQVKEDTNLPKSMVEHINESINNSINETKGAVVNTVAEQISIGIINVLVATFLILP